MQRLLLSVLCLSCLAAVARRAQAAEVFDLTKETVASARPLFERSNENKVTQLQKEVDQTKTRLAGAKGAEKKKLSVELRESEAKLKVAKAQPFEINKLDVDNLRIGLLGGINLGPADGDRKPLEWPLIVEEVKGDHEFVARIKGPAKVKRPPVVIRGIPTTKLEAGSEVHVKGVFKVSAQTTDGNLFVVEPYLRAAAPGDKQDNDGAKNEPESKAETERAAAQLLKEAKSETQALKDVVEKYPGTKAAAEAERRLKALKK